MEFTEEFRARVKTCGKSVSELCRQADINDGSLRRFLNRYVVDGKPKTSLNISTIVAVCGAMGYEICLKPIKGKS